MSRRRQSLQLLKHSVDTTKDDADWHLVPNRSKHTLRIQPTSGWVALRLGELWEFRELLYFLAWRDIKVRYKQTALGASWAIIQPVVAMIIFSVLFGHLAGLASGGVPYAIFAYSALVPWTFFSSAVNISTSSVLTSGQLVTKIYFPRLLLPIAAVSAIMVDFFWSFLVLIVLMLYFHLPFTMHMVVLPLFVLLAVTTTLGIAFWLAALNVQYRDVRYAVPFLMQLWLFATPVAYSTALLPSSWRLIYSLNPMVGVVEGFRWALLGANAGVTGSVLPSIVVTLVLLVTGAFYFRRVERTFADIV